MARRKRFFRWVVERIFRQAPKPPPKPSEPTSKPTAPTRRGLRQRAFNNFMSQIPFATPSAINSHLDYMTDEELRWTAKATSSQLVAVAAQNPDRLTDQSSPLNPWWYHSL